MDIAVLCLAGAVILGLVAIIGFIVVQWSRSQVKNTEEMWHHFGRTLDRVCIEKDDFTELRSIEAKQFRSPPDPKPMDEEDEPPLGTRIVEQFSNTHPG